MRCCFLHSRKILSSLLRTNMVTSVPVEPNSFHIESGYYVYYTVLVVSMSNGCNDSLHLGAVLEAQGISMRMAIQAVTLLIKRSYCSPCFGNRGTMLNVCNIQHASENWGLALSREDVTSLFRQCAVHILPRSEPCR